MAVEREDNVPLYDHDVVAPLITKETDIPSAAVRNTLLEQRTTERCKRYLLQRKRVRKGGSGRRTLRTKNSHDGTNAAALQGEEEECAPRVALPKARVTRKRKKATDDDEEEEEVVEESESQDEMEEVEPEEKGGDSEEEEYDLSKYNYLIEKPHYDPDDKAVYKCSVIDVDDEGNIVVYRCKHNSESGEWGEVNMDDPIHVAAIVRDDKNFRNIAKMNAILHPKQLKKNCRRKK